MDHFNGPDHSCIHMDQELSQKLFEGMMGHVGAVGDLLYKLSHVVSPTHSYND